MVSTRPFFNPLMTVPRTPITTGIIIAMFYRLFNPLAKSWYLYFFDFLLALASGQLGQQSPQFFKLFLFFLLIIIRSGHLAEIRWSVCISKSNRSLCISFSRIDLNHLFAWTNLDFLPNSQWIILPIQSCLVLYSLCANLLRTLIMWFIISSLIPHNLHLLFIISLKFLVFIRNYYCLWIYHELSFRIFHWNIYVEKNWCLKR